MTAISKLFRALLGLFSWHKRTGSIFGDIDERHFREAISHPTVQREVIPKHNEMYKKAGDMGRQHAAHGLPEDGSPSAFALLVNSWYQSLQDTMNSVMLPAISELQEEIKVKQGELEAIVENEEEHKADYNTKNKRSEEIKLERAQEEFSAEDQAAVERIKGFEKIRIKLADKISSITSKMDEVIAPAPETLLIPWYYFACLGVLALADFPFVRVVFNALGEPVPETFLMATGFTGSLIISSHYCGASIKRFTFRYSLKYMVVALITSVLIICICIYLGELRQEYVMLHGLQSKALSAELLTLINLFLFCCGVLLSYFSHSKYPASLVRDYLATINANSANTETIKQEKDKKTQLAVLFARRKEEIRQFFVQNNFRSYVASLKRELSKKESDLRLKEVALWKISDLIDSLYRTCLNHYRNMHNVNRFGMDKVDFGEIKLISRDNGTESTRSAAPSGNGAAKVLSALILLLLLACGPKVQQESQIYVLIDKTEEDFNFEYPSAQQICTMMKTNNGGHGEVYLSLITDQFKNDIIRVQLPPADKYQNPMIRKNEIRDFEMELQSKVDQVRAIPAGRNRSMVYNPIFDSLEKLSKLSEEKNRVLIVFSDLLENNSLDLYKDGHTGDYLNKIHNRYENFTMNGIRVILVHKPAPGFKAEDRSVKAIERFEDFLRKNGVTFSWEGNLILS